MLEIHKWVPLHSLITTKNTIVTLWFFSDSRVFIIFFCFQLSLSCIVMNDVVIHDFIIYKFFKWYFRELILCKYSMNMNGVMIICMHYIMKDIWNQWCFYIDYHNVYMNIMIYKLQLSVSIVCYEFVVLRSYKYDYKIMHEHIATTRFL